MQTRYIEGIVLSDIDAGLAWLDGEDMVFEIYAAMDEQLPAHWEETEPGETAALTLTEDQWALIDRLGIDIDSETLGREAEDREEPWRRVADSSEAAWYDEIEGKTR